MGIPGLRETIEACEEIVPTAQLAEDYFKKNGRRPRLPSMNRIGDSIMSRQHNSLKSDEVSATDRTFMSATDLTSGVEVPAANPVEKAMFYRICNLLTLGVELVFVFDGPDVLPKRGRKTDGRKVDRKDRELLKEVLQHCGIPAIDAPGEAEAGCCQLQNLGIVDAVWSQDSDCLMFGCTLWLRDHRVPKEEGYDNRNKAHTKKAAKEIRVVRADTLNKDHRLRREGCVLVAMLAGGDYDGTGLARCGADKALEAAQSGLGISVCRSKS